MKKRVVYFDYLRVAAIMAVIVLHVTALYWSNYGGMNFTWNVLNLFSGSTRWGVPVLVMISGSLFLSREIDTKRLYVKNISRLAVSFFVWSAFYAIVMAVARYFLMNDRSATFQTLLSAMITGHYHMWFIPMIIGVYMCLPMIRAIVQSKEAAKTFLILSLALGCVIPQITRMSIDFVGGDFGNLMQSIQTLCNTSKIHLVIGYPFYFILGYYLGNLDLSKKHRMYIYLLGLVSLASTVVLTSLHTHRLNSPSQTYYENFRVNVLLVAVAIHTWVRYRSYNNTCINHFVSALSEYSFGAYLVHVFIIEVLKAIKLTGMPISPILSVPMLSIVTIVISFFCSWVLHKIPFINKWCV